MGQEKQLLQAQVVFTHSRMYRHVHRYSLCPSTACVSVPVAKKKKKNPVSL